MRKALAVAQISLGALLTVIGIAGSGHPHAMPELFVVPGLLLLGAGLALLRLRRPGSLALQLLALPGALLLVLLFAAVRMNCRETKQFEAWQREEERQRALDAQPRPAKAECSPDEAPGQPPRPDESP